MSGAFTKLGSYRVIRSLGEGGMGAVYLAEHEVIGRQTVIKVLHPQVAAEPQMVERLFNEARATNRVKHRGIVDIYDCGYTPDRRPYLVMEYLQGQSLAAFLNAEGRQLSPPFVAEIIAEIAAALGAAHRSGIVHRDLKPENIFLADDQGQRLVKVLDFGIAQLAVDPAARLTKSFQIFGTPFYMSPEQCASAKSVDHRADIYSLGIIAYEMMCGQPPFVAEGVGRIMAMHQYEPVPPPRSLRPSIPEQVERVLLRALAKDPGARHDAIETFARELVSAAMLAVPGATPVPSVPATLVSPRQAPAPTLPEQVSSAQLPAVPPAPLATLPAAPRSGAPPGQVYAAPALPAGPAELTGPAAITVYGVPFPEPSARPELGARPITTLSHGAGEVAVSPTRAPKVGMAPWKIGVAAAAATALVAGGIVLAITLRAPSSEQRPSAAAATQTDALPRAPRVEPPGNEAAAAKDSGRASDPVAQIKKVLPDEAKTPVGKIAGEVKAGVTRELDRTLLSVKGEKAAKPEKKAKGAPKKRAPKPAPNDRTLARALTVEERVLQAKAAYAGGEMARAAQLCKQALAVEPGNQQALVLLTISACAMRDQRTALSAYARLVGPRRQLAANTCAGTGIALASPPAPRPGSAAPPIHPQPVAVATRDRSQIMQTMRRATPSVQACAQKYGAVGRIVVDVTVAASGAVTRVSTGGDVATSNPAATACVAIAVRRLTFPAASGVSTFRYPYVLRQR